MTVDSRLDALREIIQQDVGQRGLARDPADNLFTRCRGDLAAACRNIAETPNAVLGIVTGFIIPTANPPCAETDGPLGAVFLARALVPLGIGVELAADPNCCEALRAGVAECGLEGRVPVHPLSEDGEVAWSSPRRTHLVAIERVGPSHTPESLAAQGAADTARFFRFLAQAPAEHRDRCHTMRGRDITDLTRPAHRLFGEAAPRTIGIGDGGNEIGMGKMPWDVIRRNVPSGGPIACRVPTDYLIVAGVSNWGAYALAAGILLLREKADPALFDADHERDLLRVMVEKGPLVDGVTAERTATVDGLTWEQYAETLVKLEKCVRNVT